MQKIQFGSTGLVIEKNGFGCLPIQRISEAEAVRLLHRACDGGINFFDTARAYSDSEQKVGAAFSAMRDKIVLATKTGAVTAEGFWRDLETSLHTLKTDYIDIYQFHNPDFCPKPGGEDGLYDAALEAKKQGKIRHISITNHRLAVAHEAIDSGLYASLQFPFSYLAGEQEQELVRKCRERGMGFIAMKGMAGGLIRDGLTAAAWMETQENVVPIWGVQRESELEQFLQCVREGAELTEECRATIERDRKELCGEFCRGCGYCMPCPAGIEINNCARMSLMLRRAPTQEWLTEEWQAKMHRIEQCMHCGHCMSKCPYGLNTPELLQANYKDYWEVLAQSKKN
ncbi:aldo/keto reductase [Oscillibacter valericigenes]|nr:aldo/keto reductase [Oscillibacter valericigenes]